MFIKWYFRLIILIKKIFDWLSNFNIIWNIKYCIIVEVSCVIGSKFIFFKRMCFFKVVFYDFWNFF